MNKWGRCHEWKLLPKRGGDAALKTPTPALLKKLINTGRVGVPIQRVGHQLGHLCIHCIYTMLNWIYEDCMLCQNQMFFPWVVNSLSSTFVWSATTQHLEADAAMPLSPGLSW